jgi:hypothetical protein
MTLICARCGASPANMSVLVQRRDGMVDHAPVCPGCHQKTVTELMDREEDVIGGVIISLNEWRQWNANRTRAAELDRLIARLHRAFDELEPTLKRRPTFEECCTHARLGSEATRKRWRGSTTWAEITADW